MYRTHIKCLLIIFLYNVYKYRTDPAASGWATSWMSGVALGILGICLVGGAIFVVIWAKRNKRKMKASYPGNLLKFCLDIIIFVQFHFYFIQFQSICSYINI